MKILLIVPYYYPDEPIGAARWNRLTKYLELHNCKVFVIASNLISNTDPLTHPENLYKVSFQSSWIDKILVKFSKAKQNLPLEINRQNFSKNRKSILAKFYAKIINELGRLIRFPGVYWWSASSVVKTGLNIIKKEKIDFIIASHPFAICLRSANILSSKAKIPWIADMRDGWSSYYYGEYEFGTFYYKLLQIIEKKYLKSAYKIVVINQSLSESINVEKSKIVLIPNVFDPKVEYIKKEAIKSECKIIFSFAGSVHKNHCWDLFFEAIKNSENIQDKIIIKYYGGSFNVVLEKLSSWNLKPELVKNHGYVQKKKLMTEIVESDFLLVFGFNGAFGDTVTTGKIFDYIELKKPVVVIGPKTSELANLVLKTKIGIVLSTIHEILTFFNLICSDLENFKKELTNNVNYAELSKYSADTAAKDYINLLVNHKKH